MRIPKALCATMLVGSAAVATAPADAAIAVHLNPAPGEPGHFDWVPIGFGSENAVWLDVTQSASAQPGSNQSVSSFRQARFSENGESNLGGIGGPSTGELQVETMFQFFVETVGAGDLVPSGLVWARGGSIVQPGFGETNLGDGASGFVGVRFDLGAGDQFGWIGITRSGNALGTFAWGYETEPGVPIAAGAGIPSPGAAALLGLTGLVGCRRRRRGASGAAGARLARRGVIAAPVAAVAMAVAVVAVPAADAATVVHLNPAPGEPGHFDWVTVGSTPTVSTLLDIRKSAQDQNLLTPTDPGGPTIEAGTFSLSDDPPGAVFLAGGTSATELQLDLVHGAFVAAFPEGTILPGPGGWQSTAYTTIEGFDVAFPEDTRVYASIQVDFGFGWQHGWIGLTRSGADIDTFAWGYETEPGVPIAAGAGIPSPGAVALLPLGALAALRRRR